MKIIHNNHCLGLWVTKTRSQNLRSRVLGIAGSLDTTAAKILLVNFSGDFSGE